MSNPQRRVGESPSAVWSGEQFAHEALLFADERQLLDRCVPFVREAFAANQPVLVLAGARAWSALSAELGPDAERLELLGAAEERWNGAHETLLAYDRDFARFAGRGSPWRLIGEPVWLERPDARHWHRFESACNRLFASVPYYSLCLHDRRRLHDEVLSTVRQTHPLVCEDGRCDLSPKYVAPEALVPRLEPPWLAVPDDATRLEVTRAEHARVAAAAAADAAALGSRRDEIVLAVCELVANSLAGCGAATLEHWRDSAHLFVQVSDRGSDSYGALAGYCPPSAVSEQERSLWLARALADDATLRSEPGRRAVRLLFALPTTKRA